jgi:hypothetical protein
MSLEVGESEKCYRFRDGGVHCWHGPIAAFRDGPLSTYCSPSLERLKQYQGTFSSLGFKR